MLRRKRNRIQKKKEELLKKINKELKTLPKFESSVQAETPPQEEEIISFMDNLKEEEIEKFFDEVSLEELPKQEENHQKASSIKTPKKKSYSRRKK